MTLKNQKGITLIALILTVVILCYVTVMLASMSRFFFTNTQYISDDSKNIVEFNKFNMFFLEDVKENSNITSISNTEIIFENGTVYTFIAEPDKGIYRNKVRICNNIENCVFSMESSTQNKKIINVKLAINDNNTFETETNYVLKYW